MFDLAELTDEQEVAASKVFEALLSDEGHETVNGIMGGDKYLHENSSATEESTHLVIQPAAYTDADGLTDEQRSTLYQGFEVANMVCAPGSAGADVTGLNTSGWGQVHTICRDPTNDYAGSAAPPVGS